MPETSGRLDGRPIAHLKFVGEAHADPLFSAIAIRRSVKEPFDTSRPVPSAAIEALAASGSARARVGGTDDMALVQDLRALTWTAWMVEANTHAAFKESVDLMRIGKAEIEANPDGIALGGPLLEAMALMGLLWREQMLNPASTAFRAGIDKYRPIIATAMGYGWIVSRANARTDQLEAGRVYVRMNLQAARAGLSMHPVSQALRNSRRWRRCVRKSAAGCRLPTARRCRCWRGWVTLRRRCHRHVGRSKAGSEPSDNSNAAESDNPCAESDELKGPTYPHATHCLRTIPSRTR